MRLDLSLDGRIGLGGRSLSLRETRGLLEGIAVDRSVKGAALRLGLSYRAAWGKIAILEGAIGQPIVAKTKGHGSVLTDLGRRLRETINAALSGHEAALAADARVLERRLRELLCDGAAAAGVRMAASSDPVLTRAVAESGGCELAVVGSEEAVARLAAGSVDVACFHFGSTAVTADPPFDRLFADPDCDVRALFVREQGLMLAPGNPLGLASVTDIARSRARLVNRQRGAGTRLWFDRLRVAAGVAPGAIVSYQIEEFTHQAVAAVVAAGAADVGMGVRAVAESFGLDFVSLGEETYWRAAPTGLADDPRLVALEAAAALLAGQTSGYRPAA